MWVVDVALGCIGSSSPRRPSASARLPGRPGSPSRSSSPSGWGGIPAMDYPPKELGEELAALINEHRLDLDQ